jgi:hypothetical protein
LSLVPLFSGMVQTYQSLKRIERQLVIERRMVHQDDNQVIGDDLDEGHGSAIALVEFV